MKPVKTANKSADAFSRSSGCVVVSLSRFLLSQHGHSKATWATVSHRQTDGWPDGHETTSRVLRSSFARFLSWWSATNDLSLATWWIRTTNKFATDEWISVRPHPKPPPQMIHCDPIRYHAIFHIPYTIYPPIQSELIRSDPIRSAGAYPPTCAAPGMRSKSEPNKIRHQSDECNAL